MKIGTATEILTTNKKRKSNRTTTWLKFIRIDPDKENFDVFRAINEIFRNIKQATKKTLINKTSATLLRLEFKTDDIIKPTAIKYIV